MTTKNVVFIDSRVTGYETLIAGLSADTAGYLLDANQDSVDQMQRILAGYSDLDSVQVISHGSSGTLYLGSTVLNGDNLYSYQTQLQVIGSSLTETGDILLYGCNVAEGDAGTGLTSLNGDRGLGKRRFLKRPDRYPAQQSQIRRRFDEMQSAYKKQAEPISKVNCSVLP